MCLIVKQGEQIHVTNEDIVCYKVIYDLKKKWTGFFYLGNSFPYNQICTAKSYSTPIKHLTITNELYLYPNYTTNRYIHEGFHALLDKQSISNFIPICNITDKQVKRCIIPKGTEVCFGDEGDVVAVNMIVFKNWFDFTWYRIIGKFFKNTKIK